MREEFDYDLVKIVSDPLSKSKRSGKEIAEACGFLPQWFLDHCKNPNKALVPIKDWMTESYGFGELYEMNQGPTESVIHRDYTMTYPGDPTFYPMVYMQAADNGAELIQYQSGIVAFRDKPENPWFLTRMD